MAEHLELVAEIPKVEKLTVQERLEYAKKRRKQQLRRWERENDSDYGAPPRKKKLTSKPVTFQPQFMLLDAATRGDVDEVKKMIEDGVDTNISNDDGLTALHQACIDGCEEIIDILLENGAHLDSIDRELWTPLHAAAACGNDDIVEYLLEQGANIVAINADGNMAIDLVDEDHEELREILQAEMEEQGFTEQKLIELKDQLEQIMLSDLKSKVEESEDFDLDMRNEQGATMAHIAAANEYEEVLEYLLEQGASIDIADKDGWQPIHGAAVWGNEVTIEMLVESGADLDAKTNTGDTPLTLCEDSEVQQFLVDLKKKVRTNKAKSSKRKRSNSRSLSVKRTSLKDKITISQNEAKAEAILRVHPQLAFLLPKNTELKKDESKPLETTPAVTEAQPTQNSTTTNTSRQEPTSTKPNTETISNISILNKVKQENTDSDQINGTSILSRGKENGNVDHLAKESGVKTQGVAATDEKKSSFKIIIKTRKTSVDEKPVTETKPDVTMGTKEAVMDNKLPRDKPDQKLRQDNKPDVTMGTQLTHDNRRPTGSQVPRPDVTMVTKPSTLPRNASSSKTDLTVGSNLGSRSSSDANIATARSNRTPGQKTSGTFPSSGGDPTNKSLNSLSGSGDLGKAPKSSKTRHAPAPPPLSKSSGSLSRGHEPADTSGYPDSFSKRSRTSRENILDVVATGRLVSPNQKTVAPTDVTIEPGLNPNKENQPIPNKQLDPQPNKPIEPKNNMNHTTLPQNNSSNQNSKQEQNNSTNQSQPIQEHNNSVPLRQTKSKQEQPRESYRRRSSSENLATVTNVQIRDNKDEEKKACCVLM